METTNGERIPRGNYAAKRKGNDDATDGDGPGGDLRSPGIADERRDEAGLARGLVVLKAEGKEGGKGGTEEEER